MGKIFWGSLLIVIGILVVLNNFLDIKIDIVNVVIPIILIAWGVGIVVGKDKNHRSKDGERREIIIDLKKRV